MKKRSAAVTRSPGPFGESDDRSENCRASSPSPSEAATGMKIAVADNPKYGKILVDDKGMTVTRDGAVISLSKTEFILLSTLMRYPGRVLTRRSLEARALPNTEGQALDVHISHLRRKIGEGYIRTVRGVGYVLEK